MAILKELETYNFSADHAKKCIEANKHNHITTTYYLLLQKFIKSGGNSIADLSNLAFNKSISTVSTNTTASTSKDTLPEKKKEITISSPNENITSIINTKTNPTSPTIQNEINLGKFIPVKGTVNVNVNVNVNLNNLNTSLTRELDRSIVTSISPKNGTQIKYEPRTQIAVTEPDMHVQLKDEPKFRHHLSPVAKTEKIVHLSHNREDSNPGNAVEHSIKTQL